MMDDGLSDMDVVIKYSQMSSTLKAKKNLFWSIIHFVSLTIGKVSKEYNCERSEYGPARKRRFTVSHTVRYDGI